MRRFLFFIIAFSYTNFAFSQSDFKIENNKKKIVIPFQLINNLIFIPIKVNGEDLTFLLDTGVEETILFSLDLSQEIKLNNIEKLKLRGLGGSEAIDGYKSTDNKLEIKSYVDKTHEIYIVTNQDFNFSSQVGIPVNGIIGYHFFRNYPVEIDYETKHVIVYNTGQFLKKIKKIEKKYSKDTISLQLNKPYIHSLITDRSKSKASKLLIDTGNSDALWMFLDKTSFFELPSKNIDDFLGRGFSGDVHGKRGRISGINFGNKKFSNILTTFPDSTSLKSVSMVKDRVGSIGGEILSRFSIFFDYPNKTIFTKSNSKINEPFNFNMSGIEVQHAGLEWVKEDYTTRVSGIKLYTSADGEKKENNMQVRFQLKPIFTIASVRKNSNAEAAGLQKDDRILKINKQSAYDFSIQKINELLKSEEGKVIEIEVERKEKRFVVKFQLQSVI